MKEKLIRYRKRLLAYSLAIGIGTVSLTGCTDFIYVMKVMYSGENL